MSAKTIYLDLLGSVSFKLIDLCKWPLILKPNTKANSLLT